VFEFTRHTKRDYLNVCLALYCLLGKIRKDGILSIEADIEVKDVSAHPQNPLRYLAGYPRELELITDMFRMLLSQNMNPFELEVVLDDATQGYVRAAGFFNRGDRTMFKLISRILVANLQGYAPGLAVEMGRHVLLGLNKPSFDELEKFIKTRTGQQATAAKVEDLHAHVESYVAAVAGEAPKAEAGPAHEPKPD